MPLIGFFHQEVSFKLHFRVRCLWLEGRYWLSTCFGVFALSEPEKKVKKAAKEKVSEFTSSQAANLKVAAASQVSRAGDLAQAHARLVISDLWYIIRTERTAQLMLALLFLAIICWDMPYISVALYPFKLFVTMIHESCHALAARLTGGSVSEILISADESGLTYTKGGIFPIIASAGYPGAAFVGAFLIWWGRTPKEARFVLNSMGMIMLAVTIFYGGGGVFSVIAMALMSVALIVISRKASERICHLFVMFLAVMTTLQSLQSLQLILFASAMKAQLSVPNDAELVAEATGIPSIVVALSWCVVSISVLFFAFWISYRPKKINSDNKEPDAAKVNGTEPDSSAV